MALTYDITFLDAGSYSTSLKVSVGRPDLPKPWVFVLQVSLVEPRTWRTAAPLSNDIRYTKKFTDVLHELVGARMLAGLRKPGFIEYYGSYFINGANWAVAVNAKFPLLIARIHEVLCHRGNLLRKHWVQFNGSAHVMLACWDYGNLGDMTTLLLHGPATAPNLELSTRAPVVAVRQWLFILLWSLLDAQRSFGFEHRDLKTSNIILQKGDATTSPPMAFHLKHTEHPLQFYVDPSKVNYIIPKYIDFGFCSYVMSSIRVDHNFGERLLTPATRLFYDEDQANFNVNTNSRDMYSIPDPALLFWQDGARRDMDSDVFDYGVMALHLFVQNPLFTTTFISIGEREQFLATIEMALFALRTHRLLVKEPRFAQGVRDHIRENKYILSYVILLGYLGHGYYPESEPELEGNLLYLVLKSPEVKHYLEHQITKARENLKTSFAKVEALHGPHAMDFVRACLTWDKKSRAVNFVGAPPYSPTAPSSFRLLYHPYFQPLRQTEGDDNNITTTTLKRMTSHEITYNLDYADPPTYASLSQNPTRRLRFYRRIQPVEYETLDEISKLVNVHDFERLFDFKSNAVLLQMNDTTSSSSSMVTPARKRYRIDEMTSSGDDTMNDSGVSSSIVDVLHHDNNDDPMDEEERLRELDELLLFFSGKKQKKEVMAKIKILSRIRLRAEDEDLTGLY